MAPAFATSPQAPPDPANFPTTSQPAPAQVPPLWQGRSNLYSQQESSTSGLMPVRSSDGSLNAAQLGDFLTPLDSAGSGNYQSPGFGNVVNDPANRPPEYQSPFLREIRQQQAAKGVIPRQLPQISWPEFDREQFEALGKLDEDPSDDRITETSLNRRSFETSGRVETVTVNYDDGSVQVERQVTQDPAGNYFSHGEWKLYSRAKQVLAEGVFQYGLMEGPWYRWHPSGKDGIFGMDPFQKYDGPFYSRLNFRDGKADGIWEIYNARDRKIMEIPYELGRRQGMATWWWPNGQKMREIRFDRNLIDGWWMEWNEAGEVTLRDEFIQGRKLIRQTTQYDNGKAESMAWFVDRKMVLDGEDDWWAAEPARFVLKSEPIQHGPVSQWYSNGQRLMEGMFRVGKQHGEFAWWHPNGQRQWRGQYVDGKKTGTWTWWHASGMKQAEGEYVDDKPVGTWIQWDDKGAVVRRQELGKPVPGDGEEGTLPALKPEEVEGNLPDQVIEDISGLIDPATETSGQEKTEKNEASKEAGQGSGIHPEKSGNQEEIPPLLVPTGGSESEMKLPKDGQPNVDASDEKENPRLVSPFDPIIIETPESIEAAFSGAR